MANVNIAIDIDVKGGESLKAVARDLEAIGNSGKKATPGIESASKSSTNLMSSLKGLVGAGVLAAVGKQLLDFGKASIMAASDVQEMQSKFNTVFKDLSSDVTAELQQFADAANRSIYDLQGFAATLQDTFVPLGFARDSAADMSIQLVKLAEDLASFNNLNTADVVNDLQSALVGNTETLRKYGVVATQAAIDEKALAMGLEFTKGKMDAQTKAAAILAITLDSTTDAQGDAIKTADSYANKQKGLEAAMMDLKVAIGEELLPTAIQFTDALTNLTGKVTGIVGPISGVASALGDLKEIFSFQNIAIQTQNRLLGETTEEHENLRSGLEMTNAEMGAWEGRIKQATYATQEEKAAVEASTAAADEWAAQYRMNTALAADNASETENLAVSYKDIQAAEERRIAVAEEEAKRLEELAAKQRELNAATGDYFVKAIEAGDATFDTNQALFDAADASGASATQLAILGGALGLYTEEAVEAALKTALIQAEIDRLAEAYVNGGMSVEEMRSSLNTFIAGLDATAESMSGAATEAGALRDEINSIPTEKVVVFKSDLSQFKLPPGAAQEAAVATTASGTMSGVTKDLGGIIPGAFMQPVPMTGHGGELVLTPSDQAALMSMIRGGGKGAGGVTVQIVNQGVQGNNVSAKTQGGVLDALRKVGQYNI